MFTARYLRNTCIFTLVVIIFCLMLTSCSNLTMITEMLTGKDMYLPAEIHVESVGNDNDDEYRFFYIDADNKSHYLCAVTNTVGSVHLDYTDTATDETSIFRFDVEFGSWVVSIGRISYFIGADKDSGAMLFQCTEANKDLIEKKQVYPAALLKKGGNVSVSSEIDTTVAYNFGVFKGVPEALRYVLDNGENGVLNTTNEYAKSPMLWPAKGENGFSLYIEEWGKPITYLNVVVGEDGFASLEYSETDKVFFDYDADAKAWVCEIDEVTYYIGLNVEDLLCVHPFAEINEDFAPSPAVIYRQISAVGGAVEVLPSDISEDDAYRIGSYRAAEGTQTYITTGVSLTNGIILTDDLLNGETNETFSIDDFSIEEFLNLITH